MSLTKDLILWFLISEKKPNPLTVTSKTSQNPLIPLLPVSTAIIHSKCSVSNTLTCMLHFEHTFPRLSSEPLWFFSEVYLFPLSLDTWDLAPVTRSKWGFAELAMSHCTQSSHHHTLYTNSLYIGAYHRGYLAT